MNERIDVLVHREDIRRVETRAVTLPADLREGQILLAVDKFALTSNNVTYASQGDRAGFWQFFPAPSPWGRLPVWGFGDVVASSHDRIAIGARVFGFLPMSTHLVLEPARVTATGFTDAAAHRSALFSTYNQYARWAPGEALDSQRENLHAVVRPLFFTSFVLDDYLADNAFFGARTVLLSSASSKTALGAAFLLRERCAVTVCGLTSARHREFVAATGCFDAVHAYDAVATLSLQPPVAYIDFSGDAVLRHAVHVRLGSDLVHSLKVGATHWAALAESDPPPGMATRAFFGPAQIKKRRSEWGAQELQERHDAAEARFLSAAADWLMVERRCGPAQVEPAYRSVLQGRTDPARAFVVQIATAARPWVSAPPSPAEDRAAMSFLNPPSDGAER